MTVQTANEVTTRDLVGLDPWGEGPPATLLALMPAAFWKEHRALPVERRNGSLVIATSQVLSSEALAQVRTTTFHDPLQVAAADDEIELWLAVALGERTWEAALAASIISLIRAVGLGAKPGSLAQMPTRDTDVETIARAFEIAEDPAVEVLALRARLPQIRIARYPRPPYLGAVLGGATAKELRVVPVAVHRGLAVLATPRVPGPAARARLRAEIGLDLRVAICAPTAFTAAFAQVYPKATVAPAPPTEEAVFQRLLQTGVIPISRRAALDRIAHLTAESRLHGAIRLGYVASHEVTEATAHLAELPPADDDETLVLDTATAAHAMPEFWRARRCAPSGRAGRATRVVTDQPLGTAATEVIRRATGTAEVVARYVDGGRLDVLLADLPAIVPVEHGTVEHLLGTGIVPPPRAVAARRRAAREMRELTAVLVETAMVEMEDVVESAAIAAGRPWVHVDRCTPDAFAIDALDEAAARAAMAVPLARRGCALLTALLVHDTDLRRLDAATALAIDPIFAVTPDPAAVLARWYAPRVRVPEAYTRFGRALVGRGALTRPQVDLALDDRARGRALDAVLTARGLLRPDQLVTELAAHAGVAVADLEPKERERTVVAPLGAEHSDRVFDDPIDHGVARLVQREMALRHAFMPVGLRGSSVDVAFVDPLDEDAVAAATAALGRPVIASVATRRDIEVAQRRIYARPSVGERLIEVGIITREQLDRALEMHDRTGVRIGAALVALGLVSEMELAATIAEQSNLPFVDLPSAEPDPEVARLVPPDRARALGILPILDDGEEILVACTEPYDTEALAATPGLAGRVVRPVIVTETALDRAMNAVWRDEYLQISAAQLLSRSPEDSARWVLSLGQKVFFILLALATGAGLLLATVATITTYIAFSTLFYVGFSAYKFYLAYRAMGTSLEIDVTAEDLGLLDDRELPMYTILVPVYREAQVFPILAKAIERLEYPKAKLDVKILLEEDDLETLDVARKANLPSWFHLLVVPSGGPKGKPKACNYGLIHARGEYVVIYDAEDIPEPDQLKKAIVAFRKGDQRLACVQAKLNYFNRDQNLLTRWFTTEYSMWFDLFLPGLDASHAPIPLGGTSNHFPTARLRELGAWDPHNVTEDADLGMRLYKRRWTTAVIDSTTFEEANCDLYNWIRQRSRWVKGYIQTYLVHMRDPLRLYRQVGLKAFISFQFVVGGTFFGYLVNPLYWLLTVAWFLFHLGIVREIFPAPIFYLGSIGLYVGNFAFTYLNVAGCLRREYYDMVKYALLSPIYWAFMSVAAWKGFLQLFYRPSYWEKTHHGLYRGKIRLQRSADRRAA